jgi:hypothetical protein
MRRKTFSFLWIVVAASACFAAAAMPAKGKPASWKMIEDALFRVNDAPVKDWGVYETGKKRELLLVQMDKRFLLIRIRERQIFEIDPAKILRKADELLCDPGDHPAEQLAVTDWDAGDTEAVFRIRAKLAAEDRLLDVELPHQLDLSGMSPHASTERRR